MEQPTAAERKTGTVAPSARVVRAVQALLKDKPADPLAVELGLSRHVILRSAGGLPLRRGSLLALEAALAAKGGG